MNHLKFILSILMLTSSAYGQPNPQYQGVNNTLKSPLTLFPENVEISYMLDDKVTDQPIEIGCQNDVNTEWSTLNQGAYSKCNRQQDKNLRIFVRWKLCSSVTTVELSPKHVESAWKKDDIKQGSILLLLREKSLNWRNIAKPGRPFSVLKSC